MKHKAKLRGMLFGEEVSLSLIADLQSNSRVLNIVAEGQTFQKMWDESLKKKNQETSGYVVCDKLQHRIFFHQMPVSASGTHASDGGYIQYGSTILANVHTHPIEHTYLSKYTDKAIFKAQYGKVIGDGINANTKQYPIYTISKHNVDYFSPHGKKSSANNLTTSNQLFSNLFNLLKHALEVYGGKRK